MANHEIHISDMKTFLQCRRRWNWSSNLRGNLERASVYAPFFLGKMVHDSLQRYYDFGELPLSSIPEIEAKEIKKLEEFGSLWENERELIEEQTCLAKGMLDHYLIWQRHANGPYDDRELYFYALETPFKVPLRTPSGRASNKVMLAGRFDGVVQKKDDGSFWIFETKTARSIQELVNTLANEMQAGAYIYAAQEMFGIRISGVLYNILRKKIPTTPEELKDGTLTRRSNIDTTPEHYIETVKAYHSDWTSEQIEGHYGYVVDLLDSIPNKFFARVPIQRTQREIDQLSKDMWQIALEMTRDSTPIYPSPGWLNCTFCPFRAPCLAMNAGGDYEFIIEQEYRQRSDWNENGEEDNGTGSSN